MANFTKLAATAKRLIDANGRDVSVIKYGNASQDSDKPWRGQSEYAEATVPGKAVFVPMSSLRSTTSENEEGVLREKEFALFAANNDGGHELETFNIIEDDGVVWKIVKTELLAPADTRLLYMFEVIR